jgi:hypothetical protein
MLELSEHTLRLALKSRNGPHIAKPAVRAGENVSIRNRVDKTYGWGIVRWSLADAC